MNVKLKTYTTMKFTPEKKQALRDVISNMINDKLISFKDEINELDFGDEVIDNLGDDFTEEEKEEIGEEWIYIDCKVDYDVWMDFLEEILISIMDRFED